MVTKKFFSSVRSSATYAAVIATTLISSLFGCTRESDYCEQDGMVWNTTYHIVWQGAATLADSILRVTDEVGASVNVFDKNSLVSAVNCATDSLKVDRHFVKVWEMSRKINGASDGAFDPTLSPLITAWGFGKGHAATADTLRIDSLMQAVGIRKTHLRNGWLVKDNPNLQFNFSAVAKGYGCDCIAEMLRRNGVTDYMVEIGGEIRCGGRNREGGKWRISIDRPVRQSAGIRHDSQAIIEVSDCGIATSGNYRNFHGKGASAYGHTISAATGRPAKTDVLSATVVASDAMQADAVATACMALGSRKALEMCRKHGYATMLVLADTVLETDSFRKLTMQK